MVGAVLRKANAKVKS